MKPKNLISPFAPIVALLASVSYLHAQSSSWGITGSGNWNVTGNWTGNIIADGANNTASFLQELTADQIITLGADRTIGNITFTDGTTSSNNLTISGANILTLDATGGAPLINVTQSGRTLTVESEIAGNDGLTKEGSGGLVLTAANSYSGSTTIQRGTLTMSGANGSIASSPITLRAGGTLTLDNTTAMNNRLGGQAFTSHGGTFNFSNPAAASTNYAESIGALTLNGGALNINTSQAASGQTSTLTIGSFGTRAAGGTVFFSGTGLGTDARNQITVTTAPAFVNNILPYALMSNGTTVDLVNSFANGGSITPFTAYTTGNNSGWTANTVNARPTVQIVLGTSRTLQNLILDDGINVTTFDNTDRTINIGNSGYGMVVQTGGASAINNNVSGDIILAFGAREAIFHTIGNLTLRRNGGTLLTGSNGLTKSGAGTLTLGSTTANYLMGMTAGALSLNEGLFQMYSGAAANFSGFSGINFNGGNFTIHETLGVNRAFVAPINVNANATLTIDLNGVAAGAGITPTFGALTINNNSTFTLATGSLVTSGTNGISVTTATLNSDATFSINNGASAATRMTISGTISESGGARSITKTGTGTLLLSGTNSYTGATNVTDGTLLINGSTSSTSLVTVGASGTLGGTGTVGGATAITGTLSPGDTVTPADTLTLGSTLTLNSGAILALGLGTTSDLIDFTSVADNLFGSGNATLQISQLAGFSYASIYTIFQDTSTTGFTLAGITGYDNVGYTANFFESGDNYLLNFTAVPEPSAALLGGLGALLLLRRRRS